MTKLLISALIFLPSISQAILCMPEARDPNKVSDFLKAIVASFEYLKEARDNAELKNAKKGSDLILSVKNTDKRLECAISQISSFHESKDEAIAETSKSLATSIGIFRKDTEVILMKVKDALDGKKEEGTPSERAEREADQAAAVKSAWELAAISVAMATNIAVDTKKQGYLLLTEVERKNIIDQIKQTFGKRKKTDMHTIEVSMDLLHTFLNKKWKAADQK